MNPKAHRVQVDLMPQSMARLVRLKEKTEAASYAEVIKNALQHYEAMIEETESGTRDKDGAITIFRMWT